MNWLPALGIALIIFVAVLVFSRWLENKNHLQEMELLRRKQERLANGKSLAEEQVGGKSRKGKAKNKKSRV